MAVEVEVAARAGGSTITREEERIRRVIYVSFLSEMDLVEVEITAGTGFTANKQINCYRLTPLTYTVLQVLS
jgi:hypothetical protein